MIACRIIGLLL